MWDSSKVLDSSTSNYLITTIYISLLVSWQLFLSVTLAVHEVLEAFLQRVASAAEASTSFFIASTIAAFAFALSIVSTFATSA